jgi:uncharacterized membrane protein
VLSVAYLILANLAAFTHRPTLMLAAVAALALALLAPALLAPRAIAWITVAPVALLLHWLYRHGLAVLPLYAPPVLINVLLAWTFGRTLRAGRTPLIYRFVLLLHAGEAPPNPAIRCYATRLTLIWTAFFVLMALVNLVLALCAVPAGILISAGIEPPVRIPQSIWSLFANGLNYALVGLFFIVEFFWRRVRFTDQPYRGIIDFLRKLSKVAPQAMLRDRQHEP